MLLVGTDTSFVGGSKLAFSHWLKSPVKVLKKILSDLKFPKRFQLTR